MADVRDIFMLWILDKNDNFLKLKFDDVISYCNLILHKKILTQLKLNFGRGAKLKQLNDFTLA